MTQFLNKLPFAHHAWFMYIRLLVRHFLDDNCTQKAASLTYTTLLSLVPILTVMLVVFSSVPALEDVRGQVQQEQELRARRIRQLRRARMGVRNREDDEHRLDEHRPFVNPNLRRPGAVVLEIDDESPDFDELRTIDHQQLNDDRGDYASRTLYRQQQASRVPALRSVARDGSLNAGRTVRTRGRRVV